MAPDYSEIMAGRAAEAPQAGAPTPQRLAAMLRASERGAAVLTELLDSPAWNVFRSVVGGRLAPYETERTIIREQIEAGSLVGEERERKDRRFQFLRGAIEAHTFDLDLPKQLIAKHNAMEKVARGTLPADAPAVPEPTKPRRKRKTS